MSVGSRQYGYSYTQSQDQDCVSQQSDGLSVTSSGHSSGLVINVRCPSLSSARWCYRLYSILLAGLGLLLSFLWVCFHLYVLSQTTIVELRLLRYLDIFLGLVEFLSMLSLLYASYSSSRLFIIVFMTSSLGVVVLYWGWYSYYSHDSDTLVHSDQTGTCLVITAIFLLLLLPVCLHYRGLELHHHSAGGGHGSSDTSAKLRHHGPRGHRHRERSPPPKYHESFPSVPPLPQAPALTADTAPSPSPA